MCVMRLIGLTQILHGPTLPTNPMASAGSTPTSEGWNSALPTCVMDFCFHRFTYMEHYVPPLLCPQVPRATAAPALGILQKTRPIDRLRYQAKLIFDSFDTDADGEPYGSANMHACTPLSTGPGCLMHIAHTEADGMMRQMR